MMSNFAEAIPLGGVGTTHQCAKAIVFLASDAASYLAGETMEISGGLLML
jgi:3-oxoacyl-[acyl-carrier protein] reductase